MKYYGKIITDCTRLTDEKIRITTKGVIPQQQHYLCQQCGTTRAEDYYSYEAVPTGETVTYCRKCIALGRMDTLHDIFITHTRSLISAAPYHLPFELSAQQKMASKRIVAAVEQRQHILVHAVTGAGKTEMIFDAIQYARRRGDNVAVVSPRVDVIIEMSLRIKAAFQQEEIDVLYQGQPQRYKGHFVIATIHQLYQFKDHFDVVVVDEVDAFPLTMDEGLKRAIKLASQPVASLIYMSATPPQSLVQHYAPEQYLILPARFHRHALPVPEFCYFKMNSSKVQRRLLRLLLQQLEQQRVTLVFFNHIERMTQAYEAYKPHIAHLTYVHSEDALRLEKVDQLRAGKYQVVFTTTILERGFTMPHLDVIVINSHLFEKAALIQMAGRVGRKTVSPTGKVIYFHQGISLSMLGAKREIKHMNRLAREKGWIDD